MDGVGHQFFPRSRFAVNQHPAVGRRHEQNLLAQRFHGDAFPFDHAARGKLFFELTVFLLHLPGIDGMLDQGERLIDGERLFEKVVSPQFGGAHRGFDGAVARDHDDFGSIVEVTDLVQSFQAVHPGQPDVKQHDVEGTFAQSLQAALATVGGRGLVAFIFKHALERLPDAGFVVHDKDVMHAGGRGQGRK